MVIVPVQTWLSLKTTFTSSLRDDSLPSIAAEFRTLSNVERAALVRFASEQLAKQLGDENARIEQVRFLLAAVPESASVLRALLTRTNAPILKEAHFTLFCFMPEILELQGAGEFASAVPLLVRDYLFKVRDDRALAAWMAADLIGDHWTKEDGIVVLRDVLVRARFPRGRLAALHGVRVLYPRLGRLDKSRLRRLVNRVASNDRSPAVRSRAASLIDVMDSVRS